MAENPGIARLIDEEYRAALSPWTIEVAEYPEDPVGDIENWRPQGIGPLLGRTGGDRG